MAEQIRATKTAPPAATAHLAQGKRQRGGLATRAVIAHGSGLMPLPAAHPVLLPAEKADQPAQDLSGIRVHHEQAAEPDAADALAVLRGKDMPAGLYPKGAPAAPHPKETPAESRPKEVPAATHPKDVPAAPPGQQLTAATQTDSGRRAARELTRAAQLRQGGVPLDAGPGTGPDRPAGKEAGHKPDLMPTGGPGLALPSPLRGRLESLVGRPAVNAARVHTDAVAEQYAAGHRALAVAHGNNIFFARGHYRPGTPAGDRLIAHEVAHVDQAQRDLLRRPADYLASSSRSVPLEQAADQVASLLDQDTDQGGGSAISSPAKQPHVPVGGAGATPGPAVPAAGTTASQPAKAAAAEPEKPVGEGGEPVEQEAHAPRTPEEDPDFKQTVGKVGRTRKAQAAHAPPTDKQKETGDAASLPEERQHKINDRDAHFDEIGETAEESKKKRFTPDEFRAKLNESINKIQLPDTEDKAKEFKDERPLEGAKQSIRGQVEEQKQNVVGPLANKVGVEQPPDSQRPVTKPRQLVEEKAGREPTPISRTAAAPKPRLDNEISLAKESASLDELMAKNKLTEDQLAVSNEPQFVQALGTKKEAQQKAADAPGVYRQGEQKVLEKARGQAERIGANGFGGMFQTRKGAFTIVFSKQNLTVAADKAEQVRIQGELDHIYARTKSDVDGYLELLTKTVDSIFSIRMEVAKNIFEARVEDRLDDIYGWTRLDDLIFGEDTEAINAVFSQEKERFLTTMGDVLNQIAALIATSLNTAIVRVETGRRDAKTFFDGLTKKQQGLSQEAYQVFRLQFATLEDSVRAEEQELADTLAESYRSNVDSLQESFDKIKEDVSRSWIGKAVGFIEDAADVIEKLGELLYSVLSRIANVVGDILAHPIRFIENLASGVGAGFAQFMKNIDEYLVSGFFEWLRGSAGPAIKLPEKLDAAGLFDLTTQILGLTYETFRKVAVKVWGKAAVELLEGGAAAAEKGLEIVQIVHQKGLAGLWELIKASLSSLVEELIQKVKQTVLFAAIDKALAFIARLFTPVGAFIEAAQAIYSGIRFLMDNIDRIGEIVDAFLTSVELAVAGNTDAIAQKIVNALRGFIVVGIDFLAKLLGLGDLAGKVHKILNAIRAPFERALEVVLTGLATLVRALMRKLGLGPRGEKEQPAQKRTAEERKKAAEPKRAKEIEQQMERPLSHGEVITQVFSAMSKPTQAKRPAAALAEKQEQAQDLMRENQPLLKEGRLRITITDSGAKEVEEHAAVDFDVSASPGRAGRAPVALDILDEKVVQERLAYARSLKKFTGEKGFVLDDWATTFPALSRSTHQADLRYGAENKILIRAGGVVYHYRTGVSLEDIAERGALEMERGARAHPAFEGRFGVPLIRAFLVGRRIPGIPPDTFEERATVEAVAGRAEKAGVITKVRRTDTWALPDMPPKRLLPKGWGGVTHVRPRFYMRDSGFGTLAGDFANDVIKEEVAPRIKKLINNPTNLKPWRELKALRLARQDEEFDLDAAIAKFYERRDRYDVDHIEPLAEHWNDKGYNADHETRMAAARGAPGERGLQLLELSINRSKGSGGVEYRLFVGPDFTSPWGDRYRAYGDEFYQKFEILR